MTDKRMLRRDDRNAKVRSRRLLCGASLAAVLACAPIAAHAEDRYWDANGTAVGAGGTGTWNLANLNWSPNGDGVSGPFVEPWNNGDLDNAVFGGTAGTVTVGAPVTIGNITFSSAGYVLSGGTITLGTSGSTITTATGISTIDSVLAGANGLIKAGNGALVLNGANSFTGDININAGSLYAGADSALGASGNGIFTAAASNVRLSIAGASTSRIVTIGNGGNLILEGTGSGAARIRGNGSVQLAASGITMSNNLSDYTGRTVFQGCNGTCSTRFTSIGNLGEASSLGAPVTVADGTIIFNQSSQYSDSIIYLGDGDSSNRNWDINGDAGLVRNQGTGTLEITGDIDISAGGGFYAENADFRLLGILSGGNYAFNASAGRHVQLGNANTFTGVAALAGEIRVGKLADIGSESSLGAGTTISLISGTLSYGGAGDASNREWLVNGPANAIQNNGSGALNLSGALVFNAASPNPDTLTLGGSFAGTNIFSGVMSGNGNLVADGAGTWVLGGANVQRGTVTVNGGTLRAGIAGAFGAATGFIVNGGTLDLGGFDLVAPSLTGSGGTVSLGAQTLTVDAKTAQVFGGSIIGSGGLRKTGAGSLTLTGANSYTGATTVGGGRLGLDFSGAGGPVNNIVSASSALVLTGGTLEVVGAAGETNNQSFNGLTVSAGSNTVRAVSGAGGIVNLNLGAIVRAGGLVNFVLPTGGAITTSNADGVLGGWATINGSDYAKVVGGGILAFDASDYTAKDDAGTWADGDIISDTAGAANSPFFGTVTGDVQLGGLRYTAASGSTVTIGAGNRLGIDGTIIVAPSTAATNQLITGGSLTGSAGGGTLGVQHNGTGALTIASTIVDNGGATSFAKSGGGTVRLSAANSYTGGTTLSGGRLEVAQLANGGIASGIGASSADAANLVLESGTLAYTGGVDAVTDRGITLVNGGAERAIQVETGRTVEFSGLVTSPDDAGLTKTGWGTLVLSNAANDYVGVTTITQTSAGNSTLSVNTLSDGGIASGIGAASSDSANLVISNGAKLQYTGGTVAIDRGFTLAAGQGGIDVANAATTLTIGGVAAGAGTLFKDGAGTLILSGTNSYTGDTIVNGGVLRAGSARAFGPGGRNMTVNSGGTLDLGGFDLGFAAVIGGGQIDLGGRTLTTGSGSGVFTGRISGTGGYTRIGSFTQTFSGCNNDYTGVTTIGGNVAIDCIANGGQASGIGASTAAASNLVFATGSLAYTGASASTDRGFALNGNGGLNIVNAGTVLEFSGNITGGGQLQKSGAGTLLLSGNNSSTGSVRIYGGTLRAGSTTALGSGGIQFENAPGTTLDLDGYDNSVAFLFTTGGLQGGAVALGDATLTITNGGSTGVIFGGAISGSGGLVKTGGGYQQLSNCSSSYSGSTVINQGILAVACLDDGGANSSIGSSSSAANNLVLSGGTLQYVGSGGSTNRQFTLGASTASKLDASGTGAIAFTHAGPLTFASANTAQTLTLGGTSTANNILAAQITNNGSGVTRLTKTDAGTWILTNPGSTYTGITTISGGVLGVDKLSNGGLASSIGASSSAAANLVIGNGSTLRYTGAGDTTNRLFTLSAGVTFIESSGTGAIVFTDTGPVTLASNNQARTIALGGTNGGNNTLAGSIGNAGTGVTTLAKNDSGTWVLTGNHSYTGSTNINGGTLFVGGGGTTGSIASALVNNFGTLGFNRSDLLAYGGHIVGTGSLRQAGTGTTVLTGTNSYTGGTTIDAGTLQLGNGGTTGSIVGDVVDNGAFVFNRSDLVNFAGTISGSGVVRQIGSGTTVLSGINSYVGGTSILGGTLQVSADANLGAAVGGLAFSNGTLRTTASFASARNGVLTGTGTILTDAGTTFALNGLISGAGGLTKSGAGILTLGGNNSYAGATDVNAGTLRINGNQSAATGLVTVASGATLAGSGTIGGNVNVLNGGILAPGNSPGTLNINGDLSLAGGSVLNFEFGQADVAGGPLNDLVNVGGNLTLDGTINVSVSPGGNFGGGLYRVFNYGGTFTDNGLTLGSMPAGSNVTVQTSVAGQVNLINSDGLALSFWDGTGGPKFNNAIDGGNGSWHLGGVDNNWTGADGSINAAYADGTYAIFAGAPGTVTVDNGGGAVTATGMQFATDGYTINGAPLTLVGPQSLIRVGDGTAAGADFTATIAANLSGASQLVKTDAGTLVLAAANSYTGGTLINGGVLSVGADSFLGTGGVTLDGGTLRLTDLTFSSARAFDLGAAGGAIEVTNPTTTAILSNGVTGSGGLTKLGAGTLQLGQANSYTGGTTIQDGILFIGSFSGNTTASIVGDVVNNGTLRFGRADAYTYAGAITGTGFLDIVGTGVTTLTGNSNYGGGTRVNGVGGELRIAGGAKVASGGSTTMGRSTLSVDGAGSEFSTAAIGGNIAGNGSTIVLVTNGGTLRTTTGDLNLRALTAAVQFNVDGANSLADLAGGVQGSASFNAPFSTTISAGGMLRTAGASQIGLTTSNTNPIAVTITGTGSNWTSGSSLLMTAGNFSVDQGGAASFTSATFGAAPQAASLSVSGATSRFATTGDLVIGSGNGTGVLTLTDGGRVDVGGTLILANSAGAAGSLNIGGVAGDAAAAAGFLTGAIAFGPGTGELNFNHTGTDYGFSNAISGAGSINHAAGTTRLTGDSSVFTGTTSVAGGTLLVDGTLGGAASLINVATGGTLGGTGTIGGNVAILDGNLNPGDIGGIPGRLTIAGNLSLASAATLNVDFGQANVVGGALNDLIEVGGDLTLDGTLNVAVPPGGSFDPGLYRIINYGGSLTDNGLTADSGYFVQTSVANQVNLVNTTGLTMRFWDGVNGGKNDGVITGGDGLWQASGGNDNWTEYDGSANAPFTDDAFAVFSGVGGTVTVDGSLGAVAASGMQFASDGYIIAGDDIALVAPESVIRVGDGSIGGASYIATIATNLSGIGDVIKSDLGTLVLTGTSSFVGETNVRGGELRLANGGTLTNAEGMIGRDGGEQGIVTVTGTDAGGNASTWTNTGILRVGRLGTGTLNILDGGIVTVADIAYIGDDISGQGTVTVSGQGASGNASTWTGASDIVIGEFGSGTLNITAGGQVSNQSGWIGSNAGAQGIVNVSGVGTNGVASTWMNNADLFVGYDGNGTLNITDGGKVVSVGGQVGGNSDSLGEVLVSGAGSSWDNSGRINVGLFGTGTLRIEGGASVTSNDGIVGGSAQGDAVVSGTGTSWVNSQQLNIGSFGAGSLRIENGASVSSNQGYIGANAVGSAVVTGAGSNWLVTDFSMTVGNDGTGSLLVENGGLVRAEGGFALGLAAGASGTVAVTGAAGNRGIVETSQIGGGLGTVDFSLDGGVLRATQDEAAFFVDFGANDITLGANGGIIDTDGHDIGVAPRFTGAGGLTKDGLGALTLTGGNSYAGATLVNAGTLFVNGDQSAATGLTTVFSSATLGGTGTIGGDVVMQGGAILAPGQSAGTLTINGNLSLAGGSILDYEFGQANVAGGALNDLVNVGGDLILDGTINVSTSAGGTFGPGIYRVFNYGGALTDNGLALGTIPGGAAGVSVQTGIAGQVNLVNSQGLTLSFWDGAAGPKHDGTLDGGDGVWRIAGGSNNWTDANGTINADYAQDSFAIFAAAPGTVTIDNSGGNVLASGMQFAADGYVLTGDALTLTGAQAIVQVGDSSAAGAGYTATIGADLTGTAMLVKTDAGTLVLSGTNSYAGGTAINGGTLRIASDANLGDTAGGLAFGGGTLHTTADVVSGRAVDLVGSGTFLTDAGLTLAGMISGAGDLTKDGAGTLALTVDNDYAGGTSILAGRLEIGGGGTSGAIVGDIVNDGILAFNRSDDRVFAGLITGGGSLEQMGSGRTILTGDHLFTGGTTISAGTLQVGDGGTSGSITGDVVNNGLFVFSRTDTQTFAGVISGSGSVDQNGAGTTILTGSNSYTGTTSVSAGTLLVNGDQSAATGATNVGAGATLGGSGIIGGNVFVDTGATLAPGANAPGTLTINGNLALAAGATLGFEFGRANDVGGPLNDVINIGGDLVLDGTLDVTVPVGGAFDIGLYRIANYAGSLTDNGLALGTLPAGANAQVQTSIAGEVNLINIGAATLNFWDGAAGPKFDNAVNGGDGVWQNSGGNNNWSDISGAVNAGYDDGAFAIFSGSAGTVTIDNSLGAVSASGLQFATDGYLITGDTLTLDGAQAVIRVGDGTAAGAAYVATIDAELAGAAGLVKTDAGTLVLAGSNSYAGGTSINGGTLQIGTDANLGAAGGAIRFDGGTLQTTATLSLARSIDLIGSGGFQTGAGTTLTLAGPLSGTGNFTKSGSGTLVLDGIGTYGGATVANGTMFVNGNYAAATGATNVLAGAVLGGTGTVGGNVTLANGAVLAPGAGAAGTLTIGGNLSLSATTQLDFEFGEAGAVGGTLNDLVNVGGNLVLDGVLNVGVPTGGAFDVGVYRMFNYGGTLTNNGITLGTMPAGANANVQTSIAGQVNLVNSAGLTLNFWDGAAGPKNNGTINGGNGVWQASFGNDNWTGEDGAVNAGYTDGGFAIFGGTGGTVTVDNSLGAVSVAGMQFAANNYVITGGDIALTDATATVRVGDGSAAGAGFTATINSALTGAAGLVKTDAGTLVLGGANAYTGGTQIVGGTLRISRDANLGAASGAVTLDGGTLETSADLTSARGFVVAGGGAIATAAGTVFTYNGLFSGTGGLTKNGAGTLRVTADNSGFAGSTAVAGGTLAVQGSLGGAVTVGSAGRLEGAGRVGSLVNAGVVAPGEGIGSLTVAGDYTGNGGVLEIEAALGGDMSQADRLIVNGATSGNTRVTVVNRGGAGAPTVDGIKIVDVAGASNGTFTLDGDYLFDGEQAVVVGAYGYRLYKNGVSTPQDGDWYLRSALLAGENPQGPLYQPGVPVYEAYVGALQSLNRLPTLQQRVGNRSWAASPIAGAGLWGRFESERQRPDALVSTSDTDRKVDQWQAQLGLDAVLAERSDGAALVGGLTAHYGKADSSVASIFGNGAIDTQGYGVGATMTWYGPQGFYADGQVKLSWFDSDLESNILGSLARGNKGDGQAFSLELGKQTAIGRNLSITPQVQMSYAKVDFDRFADPSMAAVSVAKGESLKTRWGLAIDHQASWKGRAGDTRRTRLYTVLNLGYEWLDGAVSDVSGTPIAHREHRLSGELGLGGSYSWGDDRFTLYTEVSGDTAMADFGAGYNLKGSAGFRVRF
ncbi:fibronectin-binding autotransporter adhesin [Sphingopyxis sp. YR583]|uniref:autotransporter-associated beta strand repeat-containing protein n=1 Tax=Sphingopyxis sp. YR583 TaxID=1881047 RepID=UPI0008A7B4E4|nr:autotransporter-associated beta strand repeat-containing protein [Sphingopyxis sp. YR583]SEH14754.1 fibronectin-binding autotransporter adhesin [Sphingopyxis sp. YR583]